MKPTVTPWFNGDQVPFREGPYERQYLTESGAFGEADFSVWSEQHQHWTVGEKNLDRLMVSDFSWPSIYQPTERYGKDFRWRGVFDDNNEPKELGHEAIVQNS